MPLVLDQCGAPSAGDEELREHGLQALDAFVARAPHDARAKLPAILAVVLRCLAHDPNVADDMDAEDGSGTDEDEECAPACPRPARARGAQTGAGEPQERARARQADR